jgi:DNA polymerase-3 subunit delta'
MWQLAGHSRATTLLQQSLRNGQLSHAYLLVGPAHVGKFTLARNLAQAVNCESESRPCQECTSCRRIATSKHSDIHIVDLVSVEKKEIGIRQIAEMQTAAHLPPFEGKCKVFIFDRAEMLSNEAANSLLKTLEEPPPNILIILLTARESALLPTIASRCQRVELRPLPLGLVIDVLVKDYQVPQERADFLARLSGGCLGWALQALRDETLLSSREQRLEDFSRLCAAGEQLEMNANPRLALEVLMLRMP